MGADIKANTRGGGALERGHGAAHEPLAQLRDASGGVIAAAAVTAVAAVTIGVTATELVPAQAATGARSVNGR